TQPRKQTPGFASLAYHDHRRMPHRSKRPRKPLIPKVVATKPSTRTPASKEEDPVPPVSPLPASPPQPPKRVIFSQLPPPIAKPSKRRRLIQSGDFLDVDWMSNSTRRGLGRHWKERALDRQAHRTMNALLLRREQDVTRHIAIQGDSGVNRLAPSSTTSRSGNLKLWPNAEYYRVAGHESIAKYRLLGLGREESEFVDICLEEPGMEWDARELRYAEGSQMDAHVDIADAPVDIADAPVDIADAGANGGIGLIIQESDSPYVLTKQHLVYPHLQTPRYGRIPLDNHKIDASEYQPLMDMLHAQLNALREPSDQGPLSGFVSRTVAEEAVCGLVRTWTKIKHVRTDANGSLRRRLGASSHASQWIGVLESALAAGLPPHVVARSYHRLAKICDVTQ
ncbi:hypothetical protein EV183_004998, partial [Coemansia sp. RSA 2336]